MTSTVHMDCQTSPSHPTSSGIHHTLQHPPPSPTVYCQILVISVLPRHCRFWQNNYPVWRRPNNDIKSLIGSCGNCLRHLLASSSASRWLYPTVYILPLPKHNPYEADTISSLLWSSEVSPLLFPTRLLEQIKPCPALSVRATEHDNRMCSRFAGLPTVLVVPHVPCCQIDWCGQRVINRPAEITAAFGAMLSRSYSKTTSSVRIIPRWARFPSSCRLLSPFLCVFYPMNIFLHKMSLLHFCCCVHLVDGIIPIPCLPIFTRLTILC